MDAIEKHGAALYADLLRYFGVDLVAVVEGDGPSPRLVCALIEALPDTSLTTAMVAGGYQHYGWGADRHMLANIYDALQAQTIALGNWRKGKRPPFKAFERPKVKDTTKRSRGNTLRELHKRLSKGGG